MGFASVRRVAETGSTNSDVHELLSMQPLEHLFVLVADSQVSGRGRGGNAWVTPPGSALTCSVVIEPDAAPQIPVTWIPLVAGLAVRKALATWLDAQLKWPNDVVADAPSPDPEWGWGPKLAGILCERHSSGAIVAGIGVNCTQTMDELPVPWAGSIAAVTGSAPSPSELLDPLGAALSAYLASDADLLAEEYLAASAVIGEKVSVTLPDSRVVVGVVVGVDTDGALLLRPGGAPADFIAVGTAQWRSVEAMTSQSPPGVDRVMRILAGDARRVRRT